MSGRRGGGGVRGGQPLVHCAVSALGVRFWLGGMYVCTLGGRRATNEAH